MQSYTTTDTRPSGQVRTRQRYICKPCTATQKRIQRLRRGERWDELERAIADGEHSRAARIQRNSGQVFGQAQTA